jgi:hypothetical protein
MRAGMAMGFRVWTGVRRLGAEPAPSEIALHFSKAAQRCLPHNAALSYRGNERA